MKTCDKVVSRRDIVGGDNLHIECVRPLGHQGPHLIQRLDGRYVVYDKDPCPPTKCADCESEDPTDHCLWFDYAELDNVDRYRNESEFTG